MAAWKKKRRLMRRYDQSARVYDAQYFDEQEEKIKTILRNLSLGQTMVVLDVGCGTGLLFQHVADKTEFIVGVDISRGLLKEAARKSKNYENIALTLADADNLPLRSEVFDVVFAITLLQNLPNPSLALCQIRRIAKRNAAFAVTGLRKAFKEKDFVDTLKKADLKIQIIRRDEKNREYICICKKMSS